MKKNLAGEKKRMRLIDADALQKEFEELASNQWNQETVTSWANGFAEAAERVEDAPTVDAVERKKGKWVNEQCSECGCDVPAYIIDWKWQKDMDAKFCPMCGAKMK